MIDKQVPDLAAAVAGVPDGATVLVSGFGEVGIADDLIEALVEQGARDLTVVANNAGAGDRGVAALLRAGRVRRVICSYPRSRGSTWFEHRYGRGEVELEVVPQGVLSERIRAAGAGIGAFYSPTGVGTVLGEGKETRVLDGRPHVLEHPLRGDVALIKGRVGDRWGNLTYHATARNYAPTMAMAAALTIAQVDRVVELGAIDPEIVFTPGIYVDRLVAVGPSGAGP
jgi:3-oxoadipate CoA-transferase, alpha subunit